MVVERMIETAENMGIEGRIVNVSSMIHSWVKKEAFQFKDMIKGRKYAQLQQLINCICKIIIIHFFIAYG